ncbi:MAG: endonuclease domain-containing protein [Rhodospirillaceae bacterium]|nr:endonuclease domain-containing protein [Rhodospirillaceae bacterium]
MANERARAFRKDMTPAERLLWARLRELKTRGLHFRKQAPIGRFIVDFCCYAAKLVVEVDGSQHANAADRIHDQRRTEWLVTQGYRVLRFWNNEVLGNLEGVVATIAAELTPTPTPPHTGEGLTTH